MKFDRISCSRPEAEGRIARFLVKWEDSSLLYEEAAHRIYEILVCGDAFEDRMDQIDGAEN